VSELGALLVLAASLIAAVARPRRAPDWAITAAGAALLLAAGVLSARDVRHVAARFGPTIGFLAALLVLGEGCRRAGLFDALGAYMAEGAGGTPRRLLAMVFLVAAGTIAVLSLDATVVLLTPIVFATAARLRTPARPHVYACTDLANSASVLLPVSNLTNLAFGASRLSFARFGALMLVPWLVALGLEWMVLTRASPASWKRPRARPGSRRAAVAPGPRCSPPACSARRSSASGSARSPGSRRSGSPRPRRRW
jgi:arsenical pump membrane protein